MRLRHLLIGLGILAGLAAIALAIFVLSFDANRFKPTLIGMVEERTGRKLVIEGDLSLALLPRIALAVGRARLSGPAGKGEFAQIESARVGVAPWPLLSRRVEIERVTLDGLTLQAVRHRDGTTNFDDLLGSGQAAGTGATAPESTASPADAASAAASAVTIAQVQLRNAALGWRDEADDTQWRLQELDLDADRIASDQPGRLRMNGRLIGKQPPIAADVSVSSGYQVDFASGRIRIADLKVEARTNDGIAMTLDAPALAIAGDKVEGQPIDTKVQVQRDDITLDASVRVGAPASLQGPIVIPGIVVRVRASGAQLPADGVQLALDGEGRVDRDKQTASLTLGGTLDGSAVHIGVSSPRFSPLAVRYELKADRIDLERFQRTGATTPPTAPGAAGPAGGPSGGAQPGTTAPAADKGTPIPVPPIADIESNGSLQIGALRVAGVDATDVAASIRSGGGRIEISRLAAGVFRGSLAGSGALGVDGRHSIKMQLNGIDIGMALRDLADREVLDGRGNFAIDVTGRGMTLQALERSLGGSARIALRDGAILGIDLNRVLQQVDSALATVRGNAGAIEQKAGSSEKTAFSSLDASFAIRDGVAHSDDLDLRSPLLRVGGEGRIDVPAATVDYLLRVSLVGTLAGQGGADRSALRGLTIPVRVSGPFTSLGYRVDVAGMARDTVKRELTRELEERLLGKPKADSGEAAKSPKPSSPRDLLRGLIGR